jgi:hypothetical protein
MPKRRALDGPTGAPDDHDSHCFCTGCHRWRLILEKQADEEQEALDHVVLPRLPQYPWGDDQSLPF